jgi:hypothetical protein
MPLNIVRMQNDAFIPVASLCCFMIFCMSIIGFGTEVLKQKALTLPEPPLVQLLLDLAILNRMHNESDTVH